MSVKIRLSRFGKAKSPFYRIVVIDERKSRSSEYLEQVGSFNPMESDKAKMYVIDVEKVKAWVLKGAQFTQPVAQLLNDAGHPGLQALTGGKAETAKKKAAKVRKSRYKAVAKRVKKAKKEKKVAPPKKKKKEAKK